MEDSKQTFFDELVTLLQSGSPNYGAVLSHKTLIADLQSHDREYNVFVPVRGRQSFLEPCIRYLKHSAQKINLPICITIIENDEQPHHRDVCKALDVSYLFISSKISSSDGLFAKSLCYNVGFIKTKRTKWSIFHDLDMLVEEDFFEKLGVHLSSNPNWLQPYKGHSVMRLSPESTQLILSNPGLVRDLSEFNDTKISDPPCPGGSIVVKDTDFLKIGGYDPEFFYGYAPEDSFFWIKLEILYRNYKRPIRSHILGSASYANDPPIDIYHMDHTLQESANPNFKIMEGILNFFKVLNNKDRVFLIQMKQKILEEAIRTEGIIRGNM